MKDTFAELESLLRNVSYWIKKRGDALSSVNITLPQFQVLQLVYFGEALNIKQLTRLTGLAASTISEMVDRLVELGYITKTQNAVDRRQVVLKSTRQGSAIIRRVIRQRVRSIQSIARDMEPGSAGYLAVVLREFVELCNRAERLAKLPGS
jgi:DNA-binding MarR family transcriptional regulator